MPVHEYKYKKKNDKSKKKRYYFSLYHTNALGKREKFRSEIFDDKDDAKKAEAAFLLDQNKKDTSVQSKTFDEIFDEYILNHRKKVRGATLDKIKQYYEHIKSHLGNVKVGDLTLAKYQKWYNHIYDNGTGVAYKNKIFRLLKTLLKYSLLFYGVTSNIPEKLGKFCDPNEVAKEMKFFTFEEFQIFHPALVGEEFQAFFANLYYMGIREGEALGLLWQDINFDTNSIKIWKTFSSKTQNYLATHPKEAVLITELNGKKFYFSPTKTKKSVRDLTMPQIVRETLLKLKALYETLPGFVPHCFTYGMIKPLAETTIQNRKNSACDKTLGESKRIRVHDFRHSFASLMINSGANITVVSKYLGHSKISETLNTYSHMFPSKQQEIIDIINQKTNLISNPIDQLVQK